MQQQKMVVLGMLSIGMRYGWEMEKFAEKTDMRQWTPIGMSTIYKVLKDLTREGAIEAHKEAGAKGPARMAYSLTRKGRDEFKSAVTHALQSNASVYSDRIAGLVFVPALESKAALEAILNCDAWLSGADLLLKDRLGEHRGDVIAEAIITYYRDVYAAERKAVARLRSLFESRSTSTEASDGSRHG